jgi:hypothetical protein
MAELWHGPFGFVVGLVPLAFLLAIVVVPFVLIAGVPVLYWLRHKGLFVEFGLNPDRFETDLAGEPLQRSPKPGVTEYNPISDAYNCPPLSVSGVIVDGPAATTSSPSASRQRYSRS